MPVKIFFCYARQDQRLLENLKSHLTLLKLVDLVEMWYDQNISAGEEWKEKVTEQLNLANIILLLISPNFMKSDYCYSIEMTRAMERHERGEARVIPIILRPILWEEAPFGKLQALPEGAKPVNHHSWGSQDYAFKNVAQGIRKVVDELAINLLNSNLENPSSIKHIDEDEDTITSKLARGVVNTRTERELLTTEPREIMLEVLSIIEYEDDKEAFVDKFIDLIEKEAFIESIMALSLEKQEAFDREISQETQPEELKAIIQRYVSPEQYGVALRLTAQILFRDFIDTIAPTLEDEQFDRLETFLSSLNQTGDSEEQNEMQKQTPIVESSSEKSISAPINETPYSSSLRRNPLLPNFSDIPAGFSFLFVEQGEEAGHIYKINQPLLGIGRAEANDVILKDTKISRFHASLIDMNDGNYMLRDEGSQNGTTLNGRRIYPHQLYPLQNRDRIQIGLTQLIFIIGTSAKNESLNSPQHKHEEDGREQSRASYRLYANHILVEADSRYEKLNLLQNSKNELNINAQISLAPQQCVKIIQANVNKDLADVRSKADLIRVTTRFLLNYLLAENTAGKIGSPNDLQDNDVEVVFLRAWFPLASTLLQKDFSAPQQYWDRVQEVLCEHHTAFQFLEERVNEIYIEWKWLNLPLHGRSKASIHRIFCPACNNCSWMDFWNIVHSSNIHLSVALRDGRLNRYNCAFCGYFPSVPKGGMWHIPDYLGNYFMYRVVSYHDPDYGSMYKMPNSLANWQYKDDELMALRMVCKDMGSIANSDFPTQNVQSDYDFAHLTFSDEEFRERVGYIINENKKHKEHDSYNENYNGTGLLG